MVAFVKRIVVAGRVGMVGGGKVRARLARRINFLLDFHDFRLVLDFQVSQSARCTVAAFMESANYFAAQPLAMIADTIFSVTITYPQR